MRSLNRKQQSLSLGFSGMSLALLVLFAAATILRVQATDVKTVTATLEDSHESHESKPISSLRPTIYTYFEKIDASKRTTGMTNDEDSDLLLFWKEQWEKAGYSPIILNSETLNSPNFANQTTSDKSNKLTFTKERYESIRSKIEALPLDDFGKVLFRRWMAMAAVGGGWFSDYDNFPLWNLDNSGSSKHPQIVSQNEEQVLNKMTVYDILSPTLASGSANEWLDTLEALLEDTMQNCPPRSRDFNCFYTDSLAIHSIKTSGHTSTPKSERRVACPFDKNDPVSFDNPEFCSARVFRNKFTVHFGPENLQRGRHVPPKDRHPKHRSRLAREWLNRWQELCHEKKSSDLDTTQKNTKDTTLSLSNE